MVKICLNNKDVEVPAEDNVLKIARKRKEHVPGMCWGNELDPYGSCRLCLVEANGRTVTACNLMPAPDLKVSTITPGLCGFRKTALELMLSDHYGDCIGPCQDGCPAKSDIQGYVALIAMGKYREAVKLMKRNYILPAVLGRICPAFCEDKCRRGLVEGPLAIRQAKRFAADEDLKDPWHPEIPASKGKKIAVVGGGPAGLSCAYYLRTMGYDAVIYEAMPELGGMTRYGIPEYRLPRDILAKDIATVTTDIGIKVMTGQALGKDLHLADLRSKFDAVFVGVGAWKSGKMRVEGEDLPGVMHGIDFLRRVNLHENVGLGKTVVVVGGGNTAMDVVRTSIRLGSKVILAYRRAREDMPANPIEVHEAEEEGVEYMFMTAPVKVHGQGRLEEIEMIKMELGEPDASGRKKPVPKQGSNFRLKADNLIIAIGQSTPEDFLAKEGLDAKGGKIAANEASLETNVPGVFAGGDAVLGPCTVIECIASGRRAAFMIDLHLKGKLEAAKKALASPCANLDAVVGDEDIDTVIREFRSYNHWKNVTEDDFKQVKRIERAKPSIRGAKARVKDFLQVEQTLKEKDILKDAGRCMSCGCLKVFDCKLREYSTLYEAKQDGFVGAQNEFPMDESHDSVVQDNNKCVLCGQCVNLTQELTGEGLLDYVNRGFDTKIAPAPGLTLKTSKGRFVGDMIDRCPTGAFCEKVVFAKPGPWRTQPTNTVCNACGMGCEMAVETYAGMLVRASAFEDCWNLGHVCDIGRFKRLWAAMTEAPLLKDGGKTKPITPEEAKAVVQSHMKDMAVVLASDVTQEEAAFFSEFAKKHGMRIGSFAEGGLSTAGFKDIPNAKRIFLGVKPDDYPVLKVFLQTAKAKGAQMVKKDYDLAIVEAPAQALPVPTLVMHPGVNDAGLLKLGIKGTPQAPSYLVIGNLDRKLEGFTVVLGQSKYADLALPYPAWAQKDGTIVNSANQELKVRCALKPKQSAQAVVAFYFGS